MGYTYNCDGFCGDRYDSAPPFMGELSESFIKTSPSPLAHGFEPGETITLCRECSELLLTAGEILVCRHCGFAENVADLPEVVSECPWCDDGDLTLREVDHDRV